MARILLFDLESSPNLGWGYGKWDVNMLKIEQYSKIMSVSWKWLGEEEVYHESLVTIPKKRGTSQLRALTGKIYELFDEADVVIAHNAYRFDVPLMNAAFVKHRMTPPSPYKIIDTLRIARSQFKFPGGNSLDEVARYLGVPGKSAIGVRDLWYDCLQGSAKAWKQLRDYNNQDVVVLESVYKIMLPYIRNHPNLADIEQVDGVCPKCLGRITPYGSSPRRNGRVKAYRCLDCGGRSNDNTIKRTNARQVNG